MPTCNVIGSPIIRLFGIDRFPMSILFTHKITQFLPFDHRLIPIIKKTFSMINFQELYNRSGEQKVSPSKHPSFSIIILTLRIINRSKLDISFEMSKVRLYTITRKCSNYSRTNNLEKMPINLKKCTLHYYHKMIKKKR